VAEYRGRKSRHQAILYDYPDGRWGYYDPSGVSLRKMFLKSPLEYSRMTSGFSLRRFHPILNEYRPHWGIDYAAPAGTPVKATADGVIVFRGWRNGMGNYVEIAHGSGYATGYLHLSGFGSGIGVGNRVKQGQVIGYVGATGLATGPHVCYRFMKDGRPVDPLSASLPHSYPIGPKDRATFFSLRDKRLRQLDEVMRRGEIVQEMVMK
jgi:murein DD-endopeptidase MepM/ murein hydrolase activator NlpD